MQENVEVYLGIDYFRLRSGKLGRRARQLVGDALEQLVRGLQQQVGEQEPFGEV